MIEIIWRLIILMMIFRIGIFGKTKERALRAFEQYVKKIDYEDIRYIKKSMACGSAECMLFNGILIKAVSATDNARGHKFDRIIYDEEIDMEKMDCIVKPCLLRPMRFFRWEGLDLQQLRTTSRSSLFRRRKI